MGGLKAEAGQAAASEKLPQWGAGITMHGAILTPMRVLTSIRMAEPKGESRCGP